MLLSGERDCESKVSQPRTQRNDERLEPLDPESSAITIRPRRFHSRLGYGLKAFFFYQRSWLETLFTLINCPLISLSELIIILAAFYRVTNWFMLSLRLLTYVYTRDLA